MGAFDALPDRGQEAPMRAYQFAAAILLAIPSVAVAQTAPPQPPAALAELDLRPIEEVLRAMRENPGPCGRTVASVGAGATAKYSANGSPGTFGEIVGSVLADFVAPDRPHS